MNWSMTWCGPALLFRPLTRGAPGAFEVRDGNGTVAGTLLDVSPQGTPTLTFYNQGRSFVANALTGEWGVKGA